jgi:DNA repair and recombination protein RAD54B
MRRKVSLEHLPSGKLMFQAEAAQQAKLAALKSWSHLDPFTPLSMRAVTDNLLYNLVREDYKERYMTNPAFMADTSASSSSRSRSDTPEPRSKKRKTDGAHSVPDSEDEGEGEDENEADSDASDEVVVPGRRKRPARAPKPKPKTASSSKFSFSSSDAERRHNLRTMAENGQGGRITYVFERVSKPGYEVGGEV